MALNIGIVKIYIVNFMVISVVEIDGANGYESACIVDVGHYAYLQLVFRLWLFDIKRQTTSMYILDIRHGIDASFVEDKAVVAAVGVGGAVVNHGFVGVGDSDIQRDERPAGRFHAGLGSGGDGVVVELVVVYGVCAKSFILMQLTIARGGEVSCQGAVVSDSEYIVWVGGDDGGAFGPVCKLIS